MRSLQKEANLTKGLLGCRHVSRGGGGVTSRYYLGYRSAFLYHVLKKKCGGWGAKQERQGRLHDFRKCGGWVGGWMGGY